MTRRREPGDKRYSALVEKATALLFRIDPMGINYEINPDEYEPEVGTILPRMIRASNLSAAREIVREEFERWFGDLDPRPGTIDKAAEELWALVGTPPRPH